MCDLEMLHVLCRQLISEVVLNVQCPPSGVDGIECEIGEAHCGFRQDTAGMDQVCYKAVCEKYLLNWMIFWAFMDL